MAENPTVKLGVLISGTGTNLQAIIDAIVRGDLKAEIRLVISNRADAQGLERARRHGIETMVIDHRKFASREDFDRAILAALLDRSVELVALAGFMRLLSPVMLEAFPGRIMNIHNSLLPSFPGIHGPKDAIEYGVKLAGMHRFLRHRGRRCRPGDRASRGARAARRRRTTAGGANPAPGASHLSARDRLFQQGRLEIQGRRVIIKGDSPTPNSSPLVNPPVD